MADLADSVDRLARPLAAQAGLDLVDVEVKGQGGRIRVRVIVDCKGGVDLAACRTLSKSLSRALDDEDPTNDRYTLEVTSPGTDRPLRTRQDFDRVEGRLVKATVGNGDVPPDPESTTEITGEVGAAGPDAVALNDTEGIVHDVRYEQLINAIQVTPW